MGRRRHLPQNALFSASRLTMKSKLALLAPTLLALLSAGCAGNVRWKHPSPGQDLLRQMLSDVDGFHVTGANGLEDNTLLPPERARAILARELATDEDTPPFQFVEVRGRTLTIRGYGKHFIPSDDPGLPRRRYLYEYHGELTGAAYALRHMAPVACDLKLYSKPSQPLVFTWIDGGPNHGTPHPVKFDGELSADCHYPQTDGDGATARYDILSGYQPCARSRGRARSLRMF